jgi:mycofactocin precursor
MFGQDLCRQENAMSDHIVTAEVTADRTAEVTADAATSQASSQPYRADASTGQDPGICVTTQDLLVEEVSIDGMCGVY